MDYIVLVYLLPIALFGGWIAWQILLEKLRDNAVSKVSAEDFSKLVVELQAVGTSASKSFFLRAKHEEPVSNTFYVCLPSDMDIKWLNEANLKVALAIDPPSENDLGEVSIVEGPQIRSDFDLIPIPRIGFKNGGGANQYTPKVWFKRNPSMLRLTKKMYPRDPDGFLISLLYGAGRVNSPFEWLQSPPKLRCKSCSRKMLPVLQISGMSVGLHKESEYYIAGCPHEANKFQIFVQLT